MTNQEKIDIQFMQQALDLAVQASAAGEVPVGALIVRGDQIIGKGFNRTITDCDPSAHAEVLALREAASATASHRLVHTTLYVTLEPCLMCCGCLQHARVDRLVFGAREPRTGAVVSVNETLADPNAMHRVSVTEGVMSNDCVEVVQRFFQQRR